MMSRDIHFRVIARRGRQLFVRAILVAALLACFVATGQSQTSLSLTMRPVPPTRDPHSPGYVTATELSDGKNPPPDAGGNFIIGPTHNPAPEMISHADVLHGAVYEFTMSSVDSKIYPGIAREPVHSAPPIRRIPCGSLLRPAIRPHTRARWPYTSRNNM